MGRSRQRTPGEPYEIGFHVRRRIIFELCRRRGGTMLSCKYPHIFQPIKIGKLTLKNRITNAPTYNFLASYDNHVTTGAN